ncbi:MAG TPA: hypothetical protein VHE12_07495 [bacterium]|nr:hypothetical protein [bacterium]
MRKIEFFRSVPHSVRTLSAFFLAIFVLAWVWLQGGKYRPDDSDDAWSLAYCYDYAHHGIVVDRVSGYTQDQAGVQYFGKTYARITAVVLDNLGWTKTTGHILPLAFLLVGIALWVPLLKFFGFSAGSIFAFVASAPLFEPFFSVSVCARPESFIFMLATLAAFLFLRGGYFLCSLVIGLAAETHPTGGVVALSYVLAVVFGGREFLGHWLKKPWSVVGPILLGGVLSVAYFVWLHADVLARLPSFLLQSNSPRGGQFPNLLFVYFFQTKFLRHLPELAVFLVAVFFYFKKGLARSNLFLTALFGLSFLLSLILRHPNFHYAIFCFPAFLLLTLQMAERLGRTGWLLIGWLVLLAPQYLMIAYMNRSFDFGREISEIEEAVPQDPLPVLGGANDWYVFHDREFYFNFYMDRQTPFQGKEFYLIEDDGYRALPLDRKRWIEQGFRAEPVQDLSINGRHFSILRETARKPVGHSGL